MKKIVYFASAVLMILALASCSALGMAGGDNQKIEKINKIDGVTVLTYKDASAASVYVAGDFNQWSTSANPMEKKGDIWQVNLNLAPGEYMYKFVVNGTDWKPDPDNANVAEDGFGGENSILTVGKSAAKAKKSVSDKKGVRFFWNAEDGGDHEVYLAGDFNDWSTTADKLAKNDNVYEAVLKLDDGKYAYKFIVDGNWITDDNADETIDDGYGGMNSLITVGAETKSVAVEKKAVPADNSYTGEFPVTFTYKPLTGGKKNQAVYNRIDDSKSNPRPNTL